MNRTLRSWRKPTYRQEFTCEAYRGAVSVLRDAIEAARHGDSSAAEATRRYLQALHGDTPMLSPNDCLYQQPGGCR